MQYNITLLPSVNTLIALHPCTDKMSPEKSTALHTRVTALKCTDMQTVSVQSQITQKPVS